MRRYSNVYIGSDVTKLCYHIICGHMHGKRALIFTELKIELRLFSNTRPNTDLNALCPIEKYLKLTEL